MSKAHDVATVAARKALENFWRQAKLKGRTWGKKEPHNDFGGTNITFLTPPGTLISVSAEEDRTLIIHEFVLTQNTTVGNGVRSVLETAGLRVKKGRLDISL
jgi:hypothetical protein